MRIIGGRFRGKGLVGVSSETTRPTTNRVRENIFNVLGLRVRGASVLDVFAGVGSYSAESISRGASCVTANDRCGEMQGVIKDNLVEIASKSSCEVRLFGLDYKVLLDKLKGEKFDIVFLDAPYDGDFGVLCAELLFARDMISKGGIIILEADKLLDFCGLSGVSVRHEKYGRVHVYFLHK